MTREYSLQVHSDTFYVHRRPALEWNYYPSDSNVKIWDDTEHGLPKAESGASTKGGVK